MKTILVTGAGGSASHNFIESLRMSPEKFRIVGIDINPWHIQLSDLDERYLVPEVRDPRYLESITGICEKERVDFLHPQPDPEVLPMSRFKGAKTFLPRPEVIELAQDKMKTNEALKEHGVPKPLSFVITDPEQLEEKFAWLTGKMGHQKLWLRAVRGAGSKAALPVTTAKQAASWIDYWQAMKGIGWGDFMLSEYLPGKDFAWTSLWWNGSLVVSQGRQRIWYLYGFLSPSGTSSTPSLARTVNDVRVNRICTSAVLAIDKRPHGVYCVDMKEDKDGNPKVTEINAGRFFTTSNFYTHAGVNIPYAYVKLGMGEDPPSYPKYDPLPEGLCWVRMVDMGYKLLKGPP